MTNLYPIMGGPAIPWEMIAPHERQALENHGQSLEHLAERGGLYAAEALAVLHDERYFKGRWDRMPAEQCKEALAALAKAWRQKPEVDALATRVAELEDAIGVMVPLCLRGYLERCDEADRRSVLATLLRIEKAMHPNAEPEACEGCAKTFSHPGQGYGCMRHPSPASVRHAAEGKGT